MDTTDDTQAAYAAVERYYAVYASGDPAGFADAVTPDYTDHGHTPPGRGPDGAAADLTAALDRVGRVDYAIDAQVADGAGHVAVVWTGTVAGSGEQFRGVSLYAVADGRIASTHHAPIGAPPGR